MARTPNKPTFVLTIEGLPDAVPVAARLRRLLKSLLRGYRFRAVRVQEVSTDGPAAAPDPAGTGDPSLKKE
jgi:hypothetical protein